MAHTYSIICKDCKQKTWIGQSTREKPFSLYVSKQVKTQLEKFLMGHMGHALSFDDDEKLDIDNYGD